MAFMIWSLRAKDVYSSERSRLGPSLVMLFWLIRPFGCSKVHACEG